MGDERKAQVEALARPAPTIDERKARLEAAYEMVFALCHDVRRAWRMTIPVEPTDTDIVICAALRDARASLGELESLRAERDAALAEVERLRAQWESIPWAALDALMRWGLRAYLPGTEQPALPVVTAWLDANAPKQEPQP